jgi:translation initiation factor 5B
MIRQPIVTVLGHVDHGKTTLLDRIRQTAIAQKEAGGITQSIGTTEIPSTVLKKICGNLLQKFHIQLTIPGLLFVDTPGHEAFRSLRKRGGSVADIAILVIDINEGFKPQTVESIEILKSTKTPFLVAVNKIDRIRDWQSPSGVSSFLENYNRQYEMTKGLFERMFYQVIRQLNEHGFKAERFDRIEDFKRQIAVVPVSGKTGEGIPELLVVLAGLAQKFMKNRLQVTGEGKGVVLEVKDLHGLGRTIDAIIYDGSLSKGDYLVISGKKPKITKVKTLLQPRALTDMRTEKKFIPIETCYAASGAKIVAPDLEGVYAGSELKVAKTLDQAKKLFLEMKKEMKTEIDTEKEGLILKADNLGSLEALITIFEKYPIKHASIGQVGKKDIMTAEANKDTFLKVIVAFNVSAAQDAIDLAKSKKITILKSNIIYRLIEGYEDWRKMKEEEIKRREMEKLCKPGKIRILPGCVFRASNPAIVGCEVLGGCVKPGSKLFYQNTVVGEIKQIQKQGKNLEEARIGDQIAVSIIGPTVGRQIKEGDVLYTDVSSDDYKTFKKYERFLTNNEKKVLEEIKKIKKIYNPRWGV